MGKIREVAEIVCAFSEQKLDSYSEEVEPKLRDCHWIFIAVMYKSGAVSNTSNALRAG